MRLEEKCAIERKEERAAATARCANNGHSHRLTAIKSPQDGKQKELEKGDGR